MCLVLPNGPSIQDQGPKRVVDIGFLISKGVNVYMGRTIPVAGASEFEPPRPIFRLGPERAAAWFSDRFGGRVASESFFTA